MLNINKSRIVFTVLAGVTSLLIIFAGIQATYVFNDYKENQHRTKVWAEQQTRDMAQDLSTKIQKISLVAERLAAQLSAAKCSPCNIENSLRATYLQHTEFFALGAAFNADASGNSLHLYAPFIRKNTAGAEIERLDSYYDYLANIQTTTQNAPNQKVHNEDLFGNSELWYQTAQIQERQWLGPFYEAPFKRFVIRYTTPIYSAQQQKIGLIFIDISLDWLYDQIEKYDIKDNNYLYLESTAGAELYHSFKSLEQTLQELPHARTANPRTKKELPDIITTNELTGGPAWKNSNLVEATQWRLTTVISKANISEAIDSFEKNNAKNEIHLLHILSQNNRVAWVSLLVLIAMLSYSCCRLQRARTSELKLWIDTSIYTLIFFVGVISIWILEYGAISEQKEKTLILANKAIIEKYEREHALQILAAHEEAPVYVSVGLFIQSIEFLSATNVNVTGYIWHRYQKGQASDYAIGTVFPEAIETRINLAYEKTTNEETLKGWYFETTLRENFTPDQYPLDRQSVWIRLWHEKIGDNIVLVPDLKSYENLDTRALPGIEKYFVLSGWNLFRSYFEMHEKKYNTRLGTTNNASGAGVPELYFNIEIMRNFINPFLAHLFPLLVVVLMLYAIVMTMSTDQEKKDLLGFNAAGVVASCSALFFVALISHIQMRDELKANSVVYLEYFYLITYVIILLITANAVLLSLKVELKFIQFHDNLLPKLLYWPAISGALFICTIISFGH